MIQAQKIELKGKATLFEFEDESGFGCKPYDIDLRFNSLFGYVLVNMIILIARMKTV